MVKPPLLKTAPLVFLAAFLFLLSGCVFTLSMRIAPETDHQTTGTTGGEHDQH